MHLIAIKTDSINGELSVDLIVAFFAFVLGVLAERIFLARWEGFTKLGDSWGFNDNRLYRFLHRIYCELCPRRLYCERYKKEVTK